MQWLISPSELAENPASIVFDCRFALLDPAAGSRAYLAGHIPGARYADLERDLSSAAGVGGRHPLPDREALCERLRNWGVDNDSHLVCYDQNSGAVAARFWWLARWLGHDNVSVLDGGLDAWIDAGFGLETTTPTVSAGTFRAGEPLTRTLSAGQLKDADRLVDAREAARYRGEHEPIDTAAGHIPGAINAPFADNLADGTFRPRADLKRHFEALGIDADDDVVCYCGSGVTAAHNILALRLAGFPEPALYPGSWSEWIRDPTRPIATA